MAVDEPPKGDEEFPVPSVWRPTFEAVVAAFARGEFQPTNLPELDPVGDETAQQIRDYLADYDQVTLTELTDETWTTSVAQWMEGAWRTLIDLRTEEEGRSDLCLEADVRKEDGGYRFKIRLVYVP